MIKLVDEIFNYFIEVFKSFDKISKSFDEASNFFYEIFNSFDEASCLILYHQIIISFNKNKYLSYKNTILFYQCTFEVQ